MLGLLKGRLVPVRVILLMAMLSLVLIGIATIYAVGHPAGAEVEITDSPDQPAPQSTEQSGDLAGLWKKQIAFAGLGIGALILVNLVNCRRLGEAGYWIYAGVLLLLAVLLISRYVVELPFAPETKGAFRWIRISIAGFELPSIQPSEICKPAYIIALAWYLRYRSNYRRFSALIGPFVLTLLPMALILLEPDLGTVLLMMPVFLTMLFIAGAKVKHLALILFIALLISPLMWFKMQSYQRLRISSVLLQSEWLRQKAEQHPALGRLLVGGTFSSKKWKENWGYHLIRSKYAIASGGATGYGFGKGPFIKYDFLPERHNDFIFSIIAHQWGFVGCVGVLVLYIILLVCGLEIAGETTDPFGRLLAAGIVSMFAIQLIVNMAMTLGLTPITGITLPFISYGGSSLTFSMLCVGLLNNVGRWRPFSVAPRR
ncbi:MAG: FtsW/RodA/SpoVE family cell cycle protein [Sedimentisphaerales bacterium]|jgi:cell division protein FtsW (lipid II flippase)